MLRFMRYDFKSYKTNISVKEKPPAGQVFDKYGNRTHSPAVSVHNAVYRSTSKMHTASTST